MSQVKGQVIRQRQDRKCPWAAILITKISVADNRLGISSQWCEVVYNVILLLNVELRNYVISRQIVERRVTSECYLNIVVSLDC